MTRETKAPAKKAKESKIETNTTVATKPKWIPPNAGKGRPKGRLNLITKEIRETIAEALQNSSGALLTWLNDIAETDKAKAVDCYCKLAAFILPKQVIEDENQPKNGGATNISFNFVSVSNNPALKIVESDVLNGSETKKAIN